MNAIEFQRRNSLDPRDPDYVPEFEDYEVAEWVNENIEDFCTEEILSALGVTKDELMSDPELLTESDFFFEHEERFENAYRRSLGDGFIEPEPTGTWDWSPRGW